MTGRSRRTPARISAAAYLTAYNVSAATALGHLPLFGSNLAFRREAWLGIRSRVHRNDPEVHDDLDLSFHLDERHSIRYLPGAAMGCRCDRSAMDVPWYVGSHADTGPSSSTGPTICRRCG